MVSGFGGDPHIIARVMLKHFGLDPDRNVKFVRVPHQMAALPRCTKAWFLNDCGTSARYGSKKAGLNILARSQEIVSYPVTGLIATVKKINEKPYEIKRVIKAGIRVVTGTYGRNGRVRFNS